MTYEETKAMYQLYCIDPSLTCACDEVHICQQCEEGHPGNNLLDDPEAMYMQRLKEE